MRTAKSISIKRITAIMHSNLILNLQELLLGAFLIKQSEAQMSFHLLIWIIGTPILGRIKKSTHFSPYIVIEH